MRAQFGFTNRILTGTLAAGSAAVGMSIGQLQDPQGSDATAWRTAGAVTSAAGAWFTVDAAAAVSWRALVLARTNLTPSATVRWRIGPNASGASPVYDSGAVAHVAAGYGQSAFGLAAAVTGRYARCDLEDASNPDGFISVALAYAGPTWEPAYNIAPSSGFIVSRAQETVRSRSGSAFVTPLYRERGWTLAHDALAAADLWAQLMELDRTAASGANVLLIPDGASTYTPRDSILGLFETTSDIGFTTPGGEFRAWRGKITERL